MVFDDQVKFRAMYWGLSKTFNPTKFNPDVWATAAATAGMKCARLLLLVCCCRLLSGVCWRWWGCCSQSRGFFAGISS